MNDPRDPVWSLPPAERLATWLLRGETSCASCKFLYAQDEGYSNYTVTNTSMWCALGRNPNLLAERDANSLPFDWEYGYDEHGHEYDNWPATNHSRCELYAPGDRMHFDVDGSNEAKELLTDAEQIEAINKHRGV